MTVCDQFSALNSVGAKACLWSKVATQHLEKQSLNPFSDNFDKEKLKGLLCSKDDPNYGRPDRNSASAMRAAAGEAKMRGEICDVCEVIFNQGQRTETGEASIQFGELFSVRYYDQSIFSHHIIFFVSRFIIESTTKLWDY